MISFFPIHWFSIKDIILSFASSFFLSIFCHWTVSQKDLIVLTIDFNFEFLLIFCVSLLSKDILNRYYVLWLNRTTI